MQMKRGLGRGLESLIPPTTPPKASSQPQQETVPESYPLIPVEHIIPNRSQPRSVFDEEKLRELADSIREQGVIQPLAVIRLSENQFELIAGERRLRAARMAGLECVPAIIKSVDAEGKLALSIIENIQREDLNPIEEAKAYQELMIQFGYTQEEVSRKVGKSRVTIANGLRLLNLPQVVQEDVASGKYSAGHARCLLGIEGIHAQLKLRERILRETLTVRDVEKIVQSSAGNGTKRLRKKNEMSSHMQDLLDNLKQAYGTKVQIQFRGKGGRMLLDFYSSEDLDRLYQRMMREV